MKLSKKGLLAKATRYRKKWEKDEETFVRIMNDLDIAQKTPSKINFPSLPILLLLTGKILSSIFPGDSQNSLEASILSQSSKNQPRIELHDEKYPLRDFFTEYLQEEFTRARERNEDELLDGKIPKLRDSLNNLEQGLQDIKSDYEERIKPFLQKDFKAQIKRIPFSHPAYNREAEEALKELTEKIYDRRLMREYDYGRAVADIIYIAFRYELPMISYYNKYMEGGKEGKIAGVPLDLVSILHDAEEKKGVPDRTAYSWALCSGRPQLTIERLKEEFNLFINKDFEKFMRENIEQRLEEIKDPVKYWRAKDGIVCLAQTFLDLAEKNQTSVAEEVARHGEYDPRAGHDYTGWYLSQKVKGKTYKEHGTDSFIAYNGGEKNLRLNNEGGEEAMVEETRFTSRRLNSAVRVIKVPEIEKIIKRLTDYARSRPELITEYRKNSDKYMKEFTEILEQEQERRLTKQKIQEDWGSYENYLKEMNGILATMKKIQEEIESTPIRRVKISRAGELAKYAHQFKETLYQHQQTYFSSPLAS